MINKPYLNLVATFKPQYNNPEHIVIYNKIKQIARKERLLQGIIERGKDGRKTISAIKELQDRVCYLIEKERQHGIK